MKIFLGFLLAFFIGVICRLAGIPVPAPPALVGALLVVAMTAGYLLSGRLAGQRPNRTQDLCGGPSGRVDGDSR